MNNKFLNKVLGQIMSETIIDYTKGSVRTPFFLSSLPTISSYPPSLLLSPLPSSFFSEHCENVYGLNNEEMDYVWKEYGNIIHDKIKNEQEVSK